MRIATVAAEVGMGGGNLLVYLVAWVFALHAIRPLFVMMGLRDPEALAIASVLVWAAAGALTGLWTRNAIGTLIPAAVSFFVLLGGLKWAIHVTDTRGEWAPAMWTYVSNPTAGEVAAGATAVLAAVLAWWLFRKDFPPRTGEGVA